MLPGIRSPFALLMAALWALPLLCQAQNIKEKEPGEAQRDTLLHDFISLYQTFWHNPAYAGFQGAYSMYAGGGLGWTGLPDQARTLDLSFDSGIEKINSGLGGAATMRWSGKYFTLNVNAAYNYQFRLGNFHYLSAGIMIGALNRRIEPLAEPWPASNSPIQNEPVTQKSNTQIIPGIGVWYVFRNLNIGASLINPFASKYSFLVAQPADEPPTRRQVFATASYHGLISDNISLIPYFQFEYNGGFAFNMALQTVFLRNYMVGVSYDTQSLGISASVRLFRRLRLHYQAQFSVGDLMPYGPGIAQQAGIRYVINPGTPKPRRK